jgi:hypothetical protein
MSQYFRATCFSITLLRAKTDFTFVKRNSRLYTSGGVNIVDKNKRRDLDLEDGGSIYL